MAEEPGEKKIIVDEDWKKQVEAEREALQAEKAQGEEPQADARGQAAGAGRMPPASFTMLLSTLATEAMVALGEIPHPATGQASIELDHARYCIDTLEMLQEKTQGNLTPQESQAMQSLLHQLRLAFITARSSAPGPNADA